MNAVTKYCMLKLDCGQSDLAMLENVFSELAEDSYSKEWCVSTLDEVIAESETLASYGSIKATADELNLQQKVLDRLQRSVEFYDACLLFTVYWATREQLKLALSAMLKDEKFKKVRPHHKKFESFMQENFPKLSIFESDGYLEANIKIADLDYKFQKHGNVYINCTYGEPIYMHHENLKAFVDNTEIPTEPTEKIVGRYIEAKQKHKKLMEATKAKVASIKSEIGYSVFLFQDGLQESDNFNF